VKDKLAASCIFLGLGCFSGSVVAGDAPSFFVTNGMYPNIGMDWDSSFQYDYVHNNSGTDKTGTAAYVDINPVVYLRFSPQAQIWLDIELAPGSQVTAGENEFFKNMGVTINDLNYLYTAEKYWFRIGKYQIPFGQASNVAPGLYTGDVVGDYDFDGYIGGVFAYRINAGELGIFQPTVGTHFVDTTLLSKTYFQGGVRTKESDGGPANTESLESYSLVLDWSAIPSFYNLQMQAGYIFNAKGEGDEKSEDAYTVSAQYFFTPSSNNLLGPQLSGHFFAIVPFVEYVKFDNKDGVAGAKETYLTTSLTANYGQWSLGLTRTEIDASGTGGGGPDDYLNELSVQYTFIDLISLQVGVGNMRTDGDKAKVFGFNIDYARPF
jgi:hypothetical protein